MLYNKISEVRKKNVFILFTNSLRYYNIERTFDTSMVKLCKPFRFFSEAYKTPTLKKKFPAQSQDVPTGRWSISC